MISKDQIQAQLKYSFDQTSFPDLGQYYAGKVRDNYILGEKRILITTDKVSAFDRILTTIPFKGEVLTQMALFWFDQTKDIVGNHVIDSPDPNVIIGRQCNPIEVEMVVRGYVTGVTTTSVWYHYEKGVRNFCGNQLPDGMKKNQKLDKPIITPSTKAAQGDHDESISSKECVERGLVSQKQMDELCDISLALYNRGVEHAAKTGIILVDTKYEFGLWDGKIILMDEIHTPDSSRFWFIDEYDERFKKGIEQKKIDKEYIREWLADKGFRGQGPVPQIPDEVRIEAASKYIQAYELITGNTFNASVGEILGRVESNLKAAGYL